MTATVLEHDRASWQAHAQITEFTAADERDAMHILFPARARMVDKAKKGGHLHRLPKFVIPHVSADMMLSVNIEPELVRDYPGNLLVNAGINRMESLLIAGGGQAYDNTHCAIGVGDTATAAAATDTDLTATVNAANRYFQVMDATYPSAATQVVTFQATFATGNANLHWQEWGIAQNTSSGANAATAQLLNHKVVDLGTKTSAAAWAFRVTITIS